MNQITNSAGTLDFASYPVVILNLLASYDQWDDVEELFQKMDEGLAARSGPYVVKSVLLKDSISAEERIKVGKLSVAISDKYDDRFLASVLIESSKIGRFMAKGAMKLDKNLKRVEKRTHFVKNEQEADQRIASLFTQQKS